MAINNEPTIQPKTVTGIFVNYIAKVLPLAFDESMSYYECLCALLKYINDTIVPANNENAAAIAELQHIVETYLNDETLQPLINNKLDEMAQDGTLEELLGDKAMKKLDYYLIDTNTTINELQEILNLEKAKIIEFSNGNYTFNDPIIINKNTTLLFNNANITFTVENGIKNFNATDEILEYNGNVNIKIIGGNLTGVNICLCHAYNIEIKNVNFKNSLSGHFIELGACKNVNIDGCTFNGVYVQTSDRNFVEYVQLDWMSYSAFPYFNSNENTSYDQTICSNITIQNNEFLSPTNEANFTFYTAIGNHSLEVIDNYHQNIKILNNKIMYPKNRGISLYQVENVIIDNNILYQDTYNEGFTDSAMINLNSHIKNLIISNNKISGNISGIKQGYPIKFENVIIDNNIFSDYVYNSGTVISIGNPKNVKIKNNIFQNCSQRLLYEDIYAATNSETSNEIYVENNRFYKSDVNDAIRLLGGDVTFKNNIITGSTHTGTIINLNSNNLSNIYYDNNIFSSNIINGQTSNVKNTLYSNIYKKEFTLYNASGNSYIAYTNQALSTSAFSNFDSVYLYVIRNNNPEYFDVIQCKPYSGENKLGKRRYPFVFNNNGTLALCKFEINEDGTFNYSAANEDVTLKYIKGVNTNIFSY